MPTFLFPRLRLEIPASNVYPIVGIAGTFVNLPLAFDRAPRWQSSMGCTTTLVAGALDIFHTIRAGVTATTCQFVTKPLNAFTLSGIMRFNTWARQAGAANNSSYRIRAFKFDTNGAYTAIGSTDFVTELGTAAAGAASGVSIGPTSTVFTSGDRLVIRYSAMPGGGAIGGGSQTMFVNSPNVGVSGDTWMQLAEDITFQDKLRFFVS